MTLELWWDAVNLERWRRTHRRPRPVHRKGHDPPVATPKDQREISMRTGSLDVSENHATCSDTRSNTSR